MSQNFLTAIGVRNPGIGDVPVTIDTRGRSGYILREKELMCAAKESYRADKH